MTGLALIITSWLSFGGDNTNAWISYPQATNTDNPVVAYFRREFDLSHIPDSFPVEVTADNRFILCVNGQRAAAGPYTGDIQHWRVEQLDLAACIQTHINVIAAVVWNGVKSINYPENASDKQIQA